MGLTEIEVQQAFVGITLNAICVAGTAIFTLYNMPAGLKHFMNYFKGTYARSLPGQPGCIGRGNVVVLVTTLALIAMTVVAFVGLVEGWW
jgi:succinate dehydrogenase/fumarate reductase cytochrome b subunit